MAKLLVHDRAARYITRMDARLKEQLKSKLDALANNPNAMPGVKAMAVNGQASFACGTVTYASSSSMTE